MMFLAYETKFTVNRWGKLDTLGPPPQKKKEDVSIQGAFRQRKPLPRQLT